MINWKAAAALVVVLVALAVYALQTRPGTAPAKPVTGLLPCDAVQTVDLKVTRTLQSGDLALVTGSWTLEGKDPEGNKIAMSGNYADVVRLQANGIWLLAIDNPLPVI